MVFILLWYSKLLHFLELKIFNNKYCVRGCSFSNIYYFLAIPPHYLHAIMWMSNIYCKVYCYLFWVVLCLMKVIEWCIPMHNHPYNLPWFQFKSCRWYLSYELAVYSSCVVVTHHYHFLLQFIIQQDIILSWHAL